MSAARARSRQLVALAAGALVLLLAAPGCKRRKPEAFTRIWLGPKSACGRLTSGDVACWGAKDALPSGAPGAQPKLRDAKELALGDPRSCALFGDRITCWTTAAASADAPVANASRLAMSAAGVFVVEQTDTGPRLGRWTWDARGTTLAELAAPPSIATAIGSSPVHAIAANDEHVCVAAGADGLVCFATDFSNVKKLLPGATVRSLAAGRRHTCAVLQDGSARCWGKNADGQLGDGTTNDAAEPVAVFGLAGALDVVAGDAHTCARSANNTALCWGGNAHHQLADGTTQSRPTPASVHLLGVTELVAADDGTCARMGEGEVRCWGKNAAGQLAWALANEPELNVPTPIRYSRAAR